jgi:hypothetical protein
MKDFLRNHYERAFEDWLSCNNIQHTVIDERKRSALGRSNLKSFDFLLYPPNGRTIIAEVKGRAFKGTSFAGLAGFECWVTADDIDSLANWQQVFGAGHTAVFVFAYKIENIDVDFDGREVFDYNTDRYIFFAVSLDDYRKFMKRRSPKWKTLTLPARRFRDCAVQIQNFLL